MSNRSVLGSTNITQRH